jgi:AAA domain (dynein-related subfamily)
MTLNTQTTQASTLVTVLRAAGRAGVAVCLWGDPGTGKSSLLRAAAAADGVLLETVVGSLREPSDFAGLPVVGEHGVDMHPPSWARRLVEAGDGYLFLDEMTTAPPAVQAAMLGVVLDRCVGDLALPQGVRVVAAANPPERAADGWDLTPPLANRLLHIDYAPTTEDWIDGMASGFPVPAPGLVGEPDPQRRAGARAEVAAFIRTRPDLLHVYPTNDTATGRAWPSRRTWTMTADVLALLDRQDTAAALVTATGLVGEGPAIEFLTWRAHADLPDPADVIADPEAIAWDDLARDPSRAWAVLSGVVAYSTSRGTIAAWRDGWAPLGIAAEHGLGDVAAACARPLLRARPVNAKPPATVRKFTAVLTAAGLLPGSAA